MTTDPRGLVAGVADTAATAARDATDTATGFVKDASEQIAETFDDLRHNGPMAEAWTTVSRFCRQHPALSIVGAGVIVAVTATIIVLRARR